MSESGFHLNQQLKRNIEEIMDRHTSEWKAGHNHLIVEQVLKAVEQHEERLKRKTGRTIKLKPD